MSTFWNYGIKSSEVALKTAGDLLQCLIDFWQQTAVKKSLSKEPAIFSSGFLTVSLTRSEVNI